MWRAEFGAGQATIGIAVERFQDGGGGFDFACGNFTILVGIQRHPRRRRAVRWRSTGIRWLGGGGGNDRQEQDQGFGIHNGFGRNRNDAMETRNCERRVWRRAQKC